VLLACIAIFEIGSALCGGAPNSISLIVGRAIAGLGSAGIFLGGMMALMHSVPLHKRPMWSGLFGATFGIASVVGPLMGGVFTDKVTWRWCFFINLPIGVFAFGIIFFTLKLPSPKDANVPLREQLAQLDPVGTICFLPSMVCLILALEWGGSTYAWSSWRIILLLTLFCVLMVIFIGVQGIKGDSGTIPPRIFFQRSICTGAFYTVCVASSMMLLVYYLPIWFQAIKGVSAFESGIRMIPLVLSLVVASILSGQITSRVGYYVPSMFVTPVLASIGAGLMTTLALDSGPGACIGYQVLYGFGLGSSMQVTSLVPQAVLAREDVAIGTAIMFFSQQLGGAIFVSVGQNILITSLVSGLAGIPGLDPQTKVLLEYNHALTRVFTVSLAMISVTILGGLFMEWTNIKKVRRPGAPGAPGAPGTLQTEPTKTTESEGKDEPEENLDDNRSIHSTDEEKKSKDEES
jgi:MFS family permease